jgi:hypothetical protein
LILLSIKPSDALLEKFRTEVHDKASIIDPDNELYWKEITLGWALAQGLDGSVEWETDEEAKNNAHNFALYVRYWTDMA